MTGRPGVLRRIVQWAGRAAWEGVDAVLGYEPPVTWAELWVANRGLADEVAARTRRIEELEAELEDRSRRASPRLDRDTLARAITRIVWQAYRNGEARDRDWPVLCRLPHPPPSTAWQWELVGATYAETVALDRPSVAEAITRIAQKACRNGENAIWQWPSLRDLPRRESWKDVGDFYVDELFQAAVLLDERGAA